MTTPTSERDEWAFDIQLNTSPEDRGFHGRNKKGQIQRPDVVDDICQGLLVQARIDRIVHGTETTGGHPASLIIFGFRFHGIDTKRRFRTAEITITFQDENKKEDNDPTPIALWPNGDFTLGEPLPIDIEEHTGMEAGGSAGSEYVGLSAKTTWERKKTYRKSERASLTGSIFLDDRIRNSGTSNAVLLTINESESAQSGLVTDFRAAVLLRRKSGTDTFTARVRAHAKAHFSYNLVKGIRDVAGLSPANDPVLFKPGEDYQYTRPPTVSRFLEDKLAEPVDADNLNRKELDTLAGVLGSTAVSITV